MGAGTALWAQSVPLQHQQQISNFASFASELERKSKQKIGLLAILSDFEPAKRSKGMFQEWKMGAGSSPVAHASRKQNLLVFLRLAN